MRPQSMNGLENKVAGSLLGLAVGDALGAPVEFKKRGSFPKITSYQDGGEFNLKAGQWTDDTSLMLCVLTSLLEKKEYDLKDQMEKFMKWWKEGYLSSTGVCFDIGNTTKASLMRYENTGKIFSGNESDKASNGALMRLAPVPLFFHRDINQAMIETANQSKTTHAPLECIESAKILSFVIASIMNGDSKEKILNFKNYTEVVSKKFEPIISGKSFKLSPHEINAEGLAFNTLEAALYAFYHFDNFFDGLLFVVNLGDDSDTVGAVYGQMAGCFYGLSNIPSFLLEGLYQGEQLLKLSLEFSNLIEVRS